MSRTESTPGRLLPATGARHPDRHLCRRRRREEAEEEHEGVAASRHGAFDVLRTDEPESTCACHFVITGIDVA